MMKSIVILFDDEKSKYSVEKVFGGKNSIELSKEWAEKVVENSQNSIFTVSADNISILLEKISSICKETNADDVVFAFADSPFLNVEISKKLLQSHIEYKSEYTFADGYPIGFAPEVIHGGTINILLELTKSTNQALGAKAVTKDCIFSLLKTDINSFEIETLMAPEDWRLLRLCFDTSKKENFYACKALYEACKGNVQTNIVELSELAAKNPSVLRTVPGFYNIQISNLSTTDSIYSPYKQLCKNENYVPSVDNMSYEKFSKLVDNIAEFSEKAVISFSAWGEAFKNSDIIKFIEKVLSYDGLSVFIETDGQNISDEDCCKLQTVVNNSKNRTNGWAKVMIAVCVDAFSLETYKKLHPGCGENAFAKSVEVIGKLRNAIGDNVYPQFTRINENEEELENFFRYWKDENNSSGGNLIIQKFDDLAGRLPECKPADLSPIDRNPCWHLRRDMVILVNGDVPQCRQCLFSNILGNVFNESLEDIWKKNNSLMENHICKKYDKLCGGCDEHYTYSF